MESSRRAEMLRILLDELNQWSEPNGMFARASRTFDSTIAWAVERNNRVLSVDPPLRSAVQELQRKYLAIKSDIERFLPHFYEADAEIHRIYRLMDPYKFGEFFEAVRPRFSDWFFAVKKMDDYVRRLRDVVRIKLDAMMDDQPAGRSLSGETPAGLRPSKKRESEDELLDLEAQRPHDDRPPLASSRPVVEDLPVEAPLKKRYLGLIIDEGQKLVRRPGFEDVVDLSEKGIPWALLEALLERGPDFTPFEDLLEIWERYGRNGEHPNRRMVSGAMYTLRELLKPLGVTIENSRASGWRLATITRDPEEPA